MRTNWTGQLCNTGMIYSVKPVLTDDLYIVQKEEIFNNTLYV
jgi:hypothetical protein